MTLKDCLANPCDKSSFYYYVTGFRNGYKRWVGKDIVIKVTRGEGDPQGCWHNVNNFLDVNICVSIIKFLFRMKTYTGYFSNHNMRKRLHTYSNEDVDLDNNDESSIK